VNVKDVLDGGEQSGVALLLEQDNGCVGWSVCEVPWKDACLWNDGQDLDFISKKFFLALLPVKSTYGRSY
jgi:hypothetical protein